MRIKNENIKIGKKYWIVDESASIENSVFEYDFDDLDEPSERWDWIIFDNEEEARQYEAELSR